MGFWRRSEQRTLRPPEYQAAPYVYFPITVDGAALTPAAALVTPSVYSCVRVLADGASSCPLVVYRRDLDGGRRRVGGRTADLISRPAEDTTQADLISTLMTHLTLWGNAYLGKYRDADGRVEQLLPIDPSQVMVERRAGRVRFTVTQDGKTDEVGLDDVIHIKALSSDGLSGISPIRAMRTTLELDNATRAASTSLFANHARPSGILSMSNQVSQTQAENIKAQWTGAHAGERAGGIAVVSGEITFLPVAMPAADAQFIESRKISAVEVARAFRIPPWMVGAETGDSMTYSNVESQSLAFVMFSLQPWLTSIEQALSNDRDLFSENQFAEFLIDGLLRADSMSRAQVYEKALNPVTGWMNREEVRRAENLPPEPDAVEPAVPSMNGQGALIA